MEKFKVTIDGKKIEVPMGTTILDAAKEVGIDIPTLCHLNLHNIELVNNSASCRICVVHVEGRRTLVPSCATPVQDGMIVKTNTMEVMNARNTVLELLLSNHPKDCLTCSKSGECELQYLSQQLGVTQVRYDEGGRMEFRKEFSSSIIRDMEKCIMCRRCETMCNKVQTVGVLSAVRRGFDSAIAPAFEVNLDDSVCTHCGQCVSVCPVGALSENSHVMNAIQDLADPEKIVVVQTAPAVRAALGEEFGMEPGTLVTGKMVAALRNLGFDYVFDTDFAADVTIMEEGAELLGRLDKFLKGDETKLPILTSCCPAWVNFFESQFPDLLNIPSTARSPQQMFGSIAKTYFAEKLNIDREKMVVVSVMPCLAKKFECSREEFSVDGNPDVDYSISTRELAQLIKMANINFRELEDEDFDKPLGESTGAAVIFGQTGGVAEAALRTAYEVYTGKSLKKVEFESVRGLDGIRVSTVDFGDLQINVGISHGLGNARTLLEEIRNGNPRNLHVIEIMACPGGCVGGGGQPFYNNNIDIVAKRREALLQEDDNKHIRKSHENPAVIELYETFLGKPMSEKAHHLLHTSYSPKDKL